jgi:hypothetical protein
MSEYFWWAGSDDEHYTIGPCRTRQEAIDEANDSFDGGFYIVEAYQRPVDFGLMFHADDAIERWTEDDEQLSDEDGNLCFDLSGEQVQELQTEVRATIRAWAARHGLDKIKLYWFAGQRNEEFIPPTDEPARQQKDETDGR